MEAVNDVTAEYVRSILDYIPEMGIMIWKVGGKGKRIGDEAGSLRKKDGRWIIGIGHKTYLRARLAWLHFYGEWPEHDVDHRNLVRSDDWIDNLRDAPRCWNLVNTDKRDHNKSGYKWVYYKKDKKNWAADLRFGKKRKRLTGFNCPTAAYFAACRESRRLQGEYSRIS
jgi:hypothetical protein